MNKREPHKPLQVRLGTVIAVLVVFALLVAVPYTLLQGDTEEASIPEAPFYTSLEEALAACADNQQILIKFYTDWCVWCKVLDTVTLRDPKAIDFFTNDMKLVKINAEVDTALAQHFGVIGYPTSVLIDRSGHEIDRIIGFAEADEFLQTLRDYVAGIGTLDDLLRAAKDSSDRDLIFQIADKYKYRNDGDNARLWYRRVIDEGDPHDSLSGESRMALADLTRRNKDYDGALGEFKAIVDDFNGTVFGETAEIWCAIVYKQKGDTTAAIGAFQDFVKHHPESEDAEYAKEQIEKLKGTAEIEG